MNTKNETIKHMGELPGNQVFPANTTALLLLIGIIMITFCVCILAFFSY